MTLQVPIRAGDCDSYGHVNNAAYMSYLQDAMAQRLLAMGLGADLRLDGAFTWTMGRVSAEYRTPVLLGDQVEAGLWLIDADETAPTFGFEVRVIDACDGTARAAFRAESVWQRVARDTDTPHPLQPEWLAQVTVGSGKPPRRLRALPDAPDHHVYGWQHTVQLGELGPANVVQPEPLYRWLEESLITASAEAGWPASRLLETGVIVLQTRHDTIFHQWPGSGDTVEISSHVVDMRRRRGTWRQTMRRVADGALLVENYSTGMFLDLLGQPSPPPDAVIDALKHGGNAGDAHQPSEGNR